MSNDTQQSPARPATEPQVIVYGHSWLFYWWPVWLIGYLMALLTWRHSVQVQLGGTQVMFSSRTNLGVIYCLVILLTILITNTSMRGLVSLEVVVCGALMVVFRVVHPPAAATTLIISLGFITTPAHLCVIEVAVALMALQALAVNRLEGIDYPFWSSRLPPPGPDK